MRIGFNLLVVSGLIGEEHAGLLETVRRLGYDGVEVPVFTGDVAHYARLGRLLADTGLAATFVTIVDETSSPLSADPGVRARARDRLRWAVECGQALGGAVMAGPFHSPVGVFSGAGPSEGELERCAELMRETAGLAGEAGIRLSVEAINRFECYALNTMEQAAHFVRRVGHPNFGTMYDTFHANIEERDPVGAFLAHRSAVTHIHISENDRGIPGRGHVPWPETFRAIRQSGYDDWLTIEAFGRALPDLAAATRVWRDLFPDLDTLLREGIAFIRSGWEEAGAHSPVRAKASV